MTGQLRLLPFPGLSCYTANLAGYLAVEWDAEVLLARSVRLAVRLDRLTDRLGFSHHASALDRLPDGTRLRYAAAESPAAALPALAEELAGFGRGLVVVDNARLPWSPTHGGTSAPHWILVDGRDGDRWHVVDRFSGLLIAGEQLPHAGWLDSARLREAMTLPASWTPEQDLRNSLAFGGPVPVPAGPGALRLHRHADDTRRAGRSGAGRSGAGRSGEGRSGDGRSGDGRSGDGRSGDGRSGEGRSGEGWLVGDGEVLPFLADFLVERGASAVRYLDDLWAAAGHRAYAYRWRLANTSGAEEALRRALAQWERLPRLMRVALESADRRRPRPTLVRSAFDELLRVEEELA